MKCFINHLLKQHYVLFFYLKTQLQNHIHLLHDIRLLTKFYRPGVVLKTVVLHSKTVEGGGANCTKYKFLHRIALKSVYYVVASSRTVSAGIEYYIHEYVFV